jgi:hypothetical protein
MPPHRQAVPLAVIVKNDRAKKASDKYILKINQYLLFINNY